MALPGIIEERPCRGWTTAREPHRQPLLRGGWNASESGAGFLRNHRLLCVGRPGWHPSEYAVQIREARFRASLSVNVELIALYWRIGRDILERQERDGWGARVVDRLATDLRAEFGGMQGFSRANMCSFEPYPGRAQDVWHAAWCKARPSVRPTGRCHGSGISRSDPAGSACGAGARAPRRR
jgi:hypothetical protein